MSIAIYKVPVSHMMTPTNGLLSLDACKGAIQSIAIPGRAFQLQIDGHDADLWSDNGILLMQDVRAFIPDHVLSRMDTRLLEYGYTHEEVDALLCFTMLQHVRVKFESDKLNVPTYVLLVKQLAFIQPKNKLIPAFQGAIPEVDFDTTCKQEIKLSYREKMVWHDALDSFRAQMMAGRRTDS
jgi:hypothetical protein